MYNNNNSHSNCENKFLYIFRNCYLNKIIYEHVREFQIVDKLTKQSSKKYFNNGSFTNYNTKFKEFSIKSLLNYDKKSYIKSLTIKSNSYKQQEHIETTIITPNTVVTTSTNLEEIELEEDDYMNIPIGLIGEFVENLEIEKEGLVLLPNIIPPSVTSLKLIGNQFLMPGCIPNSVKILILANSKQMIVPGVIPNSVTNLKILNSEQPLLIGSIPNSIINLEWENNNPISCIPGILPLKDSKIEKIKFGPTFNTQLIPGFLPQESKTLFEVDFSFCQGVYNKPLLKNTFPRSVKVIHMSKEFNQPLTKGSLPEDLQELYLCGQFNQALTCDSIPNGLKTLDLGYSFNETIVPGSLPNSIIELGMSVMFNKPLLVGSLPTSLTSLEFCSKFNQSIPLNCLPDSLITLKLSDEFNQILIPYSLPMNLISIDLGSAFNQPISKDTIPLKCKELYHSNNFKQTLNQDVIPSNCTLIEYFIQNNINNNIEQLPQQPINNELIE